MVRHGETREAVPEVVVELLLRTEGERPGGRVQPVRADDQVERPLPPAVEGDVDAVVVVGQARDRVPEDELDVVADRVVQRAGEVATPQLDVAAVRPTGRGLRIDGRDGRAVGGQEGEPLRVDVRRADAGSRPIRSTTSIAVPRTSIG